MKEEELACVSERQTKDLRVMDIPSEKEMVKSEHKSLVRGSTVDRRQMEYYFMQESMYVSSPCYAQCKERLSGSEHDGVT